MSELEDLFSFHVRAAGLPEPEREVLLVPSRKFRFDFVWREQKLAVEVDGGEWVQGRHQRPAGFRRDAEKVALASAQGYRVMRVTGSMVRDGTALDLVEQVLKGGAA